MPVCARGYRAGNRKCGSFFAFGTTPDEFLEAAIHAKFVAKWRAQPNGAMDTIWTVRIAVEMLQSPASRLRENVFKPPKKQLDGDFVFESCEAARWRSGCPPNSVGSGGRMPGEVDFPREFADQIETVRVGPVRAK
jgi:hypothetical protein